MSDEIKKPKELEQPAEVQAPEAVTELSSEELEQVAGGSPQEGSSPSFIKQDDSLSTLEKK
jgi:hypothetical protein